MTGRKWEAKVREGEQVAWSVITPRDGVDTTRMTDARRLNAEKDESKDGEMAGFAWKEDGSR